MKLRALLILALVLAVVTVGAWLWFGREIAPDPIPQVPEAASLPETARTAPGVVPSPSATSGPAVLEPPLPSATPPAEPVRITSSVTPGMPVGRGSSAPPPAPIILPPGVRGSSARPEPQAEAREDLENVQSMFRNFRSRLGGNPVGSNADIMRAIMGGNSVRATLGPPAGQGLNAQGELLDRWGTPYFFHQLSKTSMEVRSAGPDLTMYTADDLISK